MRVTLGARPDDGGADLRRRRGQGRIQEKRSPVFRPNVL